MNIDSQHGKFITLEGIEGAGKTTHIATIQNFLTARAIPHIVTREPGGTELGQAIRARLLSPEYDPTAAAELCLLFADRAEHVLKILKPTLEEGTWVISDRYVDASFAYQGGGRGIPQEVIAALARYVCQGISPDLTLLFDIPVEAALQRITQRGQQDRFEMEKADFFQRVQSTYYELMAKEPERWKRIESDRPVEQVKQAVEDLLEDFCHGI